MGARSYARRADRAVSSRTTMIIQLPVSGIGVVLRQPTGAEDILVLESKGAVRTSIALAERLASRTDAAALDVAALPACDLERLIMELRREVLGDVIASRALCSAPECAAAVDVSFRITDYVAVQRPRIPAGVDPVETEPGWFALQKDGVEFRLVTAADLAAAEDAGQPERELSRRTTRPESAPARAIARAQRAMRAMAPCLPREIAGRCPECGRTAWFAFHPFGYVHDELR